MQTPRDAESAVNRYALSGSGIPCILVGFGTYLARLLSPDLRRRFRFIITDFRGSDLSDDSIDIGAITLQSILEDIDAVRQHLGHEKVAVMGLSICGTVAIDYALAYPEHVSHLILLCPSPCWTPEYRAFQQDYMVAHLSPERRALLERNQQALAAEAGAVPREEVFLKQYIAQSPLYWCNPEFDPTPFWHGIHVNMDFVMHFDTPAYYPHDETARFPELNMPVFLALGKHDFATPPTAWDNYRDRIPDLTVRLFEKSAHHPMHEEQRLFDKTLLEWIDSKT